MITESTQTGMAGSGRTAAMLFAAMLAVGTPAIGLAQAVDTSEWVCEFCPFESGARADVGVGATSVSDDSAYFGDATGYDEDGVYADVDGTGSYASEAHRMRWAVEDLGLDARAAALEGGKPGSYDYHVGYRELPRRRFNTTRTIFDEASVDSLVLPSGWVRAPTTAGLTALDSSLVSRNIESDRSVIDAGIGYTGLRNFDVFADYRRHEQDGVKIYGGSSFTNASLLPMPFDYVTDEVDLGVRYGTSRGHVALGWYLSDFENSAAGFGWQQPFTTVPGADVPTLARAPDSRFQQLKLSGGLALPESRTWISASAAMGRAEQDTPFLPYTVNPNIAAGALPRADLGGDVDTVNYALSITSRPIDRTRIRFSYRYDERDNQTPVSTWSRVIVDAFASGDPETNIPYSFERSVLKLEGDYALFPMLDLSAGYERRDTDRDFQEVAEQSEDTGWGQLRWRPLASVDVEFRGGASKRDIDRYDETLAASFGQNPLLRKYNLAYRYREFGELNVNWSPEGAPVSIGISSLYADDSYSQSEVGLVSGDELLVSLDAGWTVSERASLYLTAGFDEIESTQTGSEAFAMPDWRARHDDSFTHLGAGLRIRQISGNLDLEFDYLRSEGTTEITVDPAAAAASRFPDLETSLDYLRVGLEYRRSATLSVVADLRWQRFEAEDWALEGVEPATIPVVLSLGAQPYDDDVLVVGVGFRYRLGGKAAE